MYSYDDLQARWKALRGSGDVRVREIACVGAPRTLLCVEMGSHTAPEIAIAAGVHGDEPAGPWALLAMIENGDLDATFAYRMWPCTNPSGFRAGTRVSEDVVDVNRSFGRGGQTPEARAIVTANRDRKFVLSIDLHEDCDAEGFYCYEYGAGDVGHAVVSAVRTAGFAIQDLTRCDLGAPFEDPELLDGIVRPTRTVESDLIGGLSYTMLIARHAAKRALTFETATRLPLEERIAIHRIAVKAAIAALANP
jgi:hypothetical protein